MTSKIYYRGFIEDVRNDKCTDEEISYLASILVNIVKRQATTRTWKAFYRLADFPGLEDGMDGFNLTLQKEDETKTSENWVATFEDGPKNLKIYVKIEGC